MNTLRCVFLAIGAIVTIADVHSDDEASSSLVIELVETLDGAIAAANLATPYDLIGRNETTSQFEDEIVASSNLDFRVQFDGEREYLRWAFCEKKEAFDDQATPGSLRYFAAEVIGRELSVFDGVRLGPPRRYESFKQAAAQVRVPSPEILSVVPYRLFVDSKQSLKRLKATIMHPNTTIKVEPSPGSIRYVVRHEESAKRYSIHTWQFRLPDYATQLITLDRSVTGELKRYWTQRTMWEPFRENIRPFHISTETGIIRRKETGFDLGQKLVDGEFFWSDFDQDIPDKPTISGVIRIQKYLDEGIAIARKSKEAAPATK